MKLDCKFRSSQARKTLELESTRWKRSNIIPLNKKKTLCFLNIGNTIIWTEELKDVDKIY